MMYISPWKVAIIIAVSLFGLIFSFPNLVSNDALKGLPSWFPQKQMPLGLDLQGGSHLLLQMNVDELRQNWLENIEGEVRKEMRGERGGSVQKDRIPYTSLAVVNGSVRLTLRDPSNMDAALRRLQVLPQPLSSSIFTGTSSLDLEIAADGPNAIVIKPVPQALSERVTAALSASIETIRRRVDALGTTEPIIQRQGADRILVQVPGFNDPERLKRVINTTARLTFQLVDQTMTAEEAAATRPPPGTSVFQSVDEAEGPYLLRNEVIVGGEDLVDAQPGFDQQTNEPIVSFRFNATGGRRFGQVTQDNVGRPFAIVLDKKVISAPVIREPILGGSGQISGNFSVQEVNELSIQLRSGALPASLQIVEERSVGPSLGADSIEAGKLASIIAFVAVAVYMIAGYGLFGVFAVFALVINIALIVAALSLLQATLTLPGIAGIALTMGMAVDANVLIYERIREEVRARKTPVVAIDSGFTRASGTIFDSNITGLLAAIIMFALGSGPVRGFAVTMTLGILASMFTALTVTRYLIIQWVKWTRPTAVPI